MSRFSRFGEARFAKFGGGRRLVETRVVSSGNDLGGLLSRQKEAM